MNITLPSAYRILFALALCVLSAQVFGLSTLLPDSSFGTSGVVLTSPLGGSVAAAVKSVIQQSDGKLVAGGSSNNDFVIVRYNADGTLDSSFGSGGIVETNINGTDTLFTVQQGADGKLVAYGYSESGLVLVRYNVDGSVDTTFGSNGIAIATGTSGGGYGGNPSPGSGLVQQADGKWVAVGLNSSLSTGSESFRFTASGILDSGFGNGGIVSTPSPTLWATLAQQADGKIIIGGCSSSFGCIDFLLTRYNTNGTLDTTFGVNGIVKTDISGGKDGIQAIAIQGDGKIIAAGNNGLGAGYSAPLTELARYNTNGSLDTSFGTNGKVTTNAMTGNEMVGGIAVQPDGRILVGGSGTNGSNNDILLLRYNSDGTLDTSLNGSGKVTLDTGGDDYSYAMSLQSDGSVVIAGYSNVSGVNRFLLTRLVSVSLPDTDGDGVPDTLDYAPNDASIYCAPGKYWSGSACVTASAGYYVPNQKSTSQTACATGTYQPNTGQTSCIIDTTCTLGVTYQTTAPTLTSNRVCSADTTCTLGVTYQTTAPTLTSNRVCGAVGTCTLGVNYQTTAPTLTSNRVCSADTTCVLGTSYQTAAPTLLSDRVCTVDTSCVTGISYESVAPTLTSDMVCTELYGRELCNLFTDFRCLHNMSCGLCIVRRLMHLASCKE